MGVFAPFAAAAENRDAYQQPDRVIRDLGLAPGATAADVGCGRGYFTFRLARAVGEKGKVLAEDIDAKALESVKQRAEKEGLTQVETVTGDGADTKLPDAAVDVAMFCDVLHHVPADQRGAIVKDAVRALKPGGLLVIIDWRMDATIGHDRGRRIPREDLAKLATDAGCVLDAEFHYLEHQVFLRFRKPEK
jgi:ubiquinone/menaquinone biosynthesis C-methylase UbiE